MRRLIHAHISIAPLAVFRVLFGFIMAVSVVRLAARGWVGSLYVEPSYHFTFFGFGWVTPLGPTGIYVLFAVMCLAAIGIMLGWHYRIAAAVFFLTFAYVEFIDKANYLNHYYFVSIIAFLMLCLPAHRAFSMDVRQRPKLAVDTVPAWTVNVLKLQLAVVYIFAGAAKLHPEWLLEAMPLRLWLPAHAHLPLLGPLLSEPATAYVFSWFGAVYDLTIIFFLLWRRSRSVAYLAVLAFHLVTALLFQIGMFPYIMILSTLIFFSPQFHEALLARAKSLWHTVAQQKQHNLQPVVHRVPVHFAPGRRGAPALAVLLGVHFLLQLVVPLRSFAYPGDLFWTEQGYRFSWRVMLMEKAGVAAFRVHDPASGRRWEVANYEYLTPNQEKMMSTQPDMILQFAHHLADEYRKAGMDSVEITAEARVTLNGRRSRLLIDPKVDLVRVKQGLHHKDWILPLTGQEKSWISRR